MTKHEVDAVPEKELGEAQGGGIQFIPVVEYMPRGRHPNAPRPGDAIMDNLNDDLRDVLD